jgi:UDP-N-acetylglucosamine--N-acetylmuramyl-(pentapeptide) pyrophosphoryl-undecaprenol N-acetylglucosamine transferase
VAEYDRVAKGPLRGKRPLIFATVGTHRQPFERMLDGLQGLPDPTDVVVQYGCGRPPEGVGRAVAFMPFDEIQECLEAADKVVTHAGVGSILCARRAGHVPVVVPRLRALGEHVDDHQVELTRALAERGVVVPAWQGEELAAVVEGAPPRRTDRVTSQAVGPLAVAVRDALLGAQ